LLHFYNSYTARETLSSRSDDFHDFSRQPDFDETHTGWTAFVGLQPLPFLGAELQYLDFGHVTKYVFGAQDSTRARALALFAKGTVSLPFVDLYAKAGVGRLQTTTSSLYADPNGCLDHPTSCGLFGPHVSRTDARFGGGLGAEFKLSSLAIRAEYVRFRGPDGDPDLLSAALLWKF
jgi:hypothetical protein